MNFIRKRPYLSSFLLAAAGGILLGFLFLIPGSINVDDTDLSVLISALVIMLCAGAFLVYPVILTAINLLFLFIRTEDVRMLKTGRGFEWITLLLGSLYSLLVLIFFEIQFRADWTEQLSNNQVHTPVWTEAWPTVILLCALGIGGYLLLSSCPLIKLPPLLIVASISAMYLGAGQCILWIVQLFSEKYLILCLFPANCILIAAKTVRNKIREWNSRGGGPAAVLKNPLLSYINRKLCNAALWPVAALLLMWPLLGICIAVLAVFGQRPDAAIRAWTETSDWNLSQQTAPQNIFYDEHYLCTVAAGGHRKVVKPLRMGLRHGHPVIVNRQLCVANAFEQLLEERTPVFHRHVRHFYDTYGFPIARLIRSPYVADAIYFLMKPLEYLFLLVLYTCDVNPENRIAVQYMK